MTSGPAMPSRSRKRIPSAGLKGCATRWKWPRKCPQTRLVKVCDREADFFELFDEQRRNPCVDLLVRANHNRVITDEPFKLFEAVRQSPLQTKVQVHVPRQSARPKLSKKKAKPKRPSRQAELEVRY